LDFDPHIPQSWQEYLYDWRNAARRRRILLYGPEGTGKDTLVNLFIHELREQYGEDNLALLTILPEKDDCYVGQLEVKARDLVKVAELAKQAGKYVFIYFRELEGLFATGHHTSSWESRYMAELRDAIAGQTSLAADCIMATTNRLTLGPALVSRFDKYAIRMDRHQAAAVLQKHWPHGETNGVNSQYVADRLSRESIAELTLVSRKTRVLRAPDITGLNGRFLSGLAADVQQKVISKRRREPGHQADRALVDRVTRRHLESILAPVSEAVLRGDFATISELFVEPIDRADPPIAVRPTLEGWCDQSEFLA
jgi:SpoVK/Ycf46/Vps4 family AAA+-type ATPase